jgi:predicted DNA-binding protein (MmcQ/YjbR family)
MHSNPRKKLTSAETSLREFALAFPEATEDFPWGHRAFKVNKKIFATLVSEAEITTVSLKLPKSGKIALKRQEAEPTHYGMGKHGWVTFTYDVGDDLPVTQLKAWMDESFRAIAPKKLVAELGDGAPKARKVAKPAARRKTASISYKSLTSGGRGRART